MQNRDKIDVGTNFCMPRSVVIVDCISIAFLLLMAGAYAICVRRESPASSTEYLFLLLPGILLVFAVRRLFINLSVVEIALSANELELIKTKSKVVVEWRNIKSIAQTYGFFSGLVLNCEGGRRIFIPSGVSQFRELQKQIAQKTSEARC